MKAYTIHWSSGVEGVDEGGHVVVCAESITKAIARFQDVYHPKNRTIDSVYQESKEVLLP